MKIDVYFTPLGLKEDDLAGRGVVVIDVLRATTTIVTRRVVRGSRAPHRQPREERHPAGGRA